MRRGDLKWGGGLFSALFVLFGCGGNAAPDSSATGGNAVSEGGALAAGSGGIASGGAATGGTAKGGAATGGTATGGAAKGGAGTGGTATGGAATTGGTAASGSGGLVQGGAGGTSEPMLEPVRVIRGAPTQSGWFDLTVQGVGLESYEGKVVTVRIGMPDRAPERLGSGQARVEAGAFELFFPQVWEDSLYKLKVVYIDVDGDGVCDPVSDRLFADSRASLAPTLTVRGSGVHQPLEFFASSAANYCAPFNSEWPRE